MKPVLRKVTLSQVTVQAFEERNHVRNACSSDAEAHMNLLHDCRFPKPVSRIVVGCDRIQQDEANERRTQYKDAWRKACEDGKLP